MNKVILFFIGFFLIHISLSAQTSNEKIAYIVDSIPVINDPDKDDNISQNDVADLNVIRNKDSLKVLGYEQFDGAIYIFTKEYRNRPDSLKHIPSTKQMEKKDGIWLLHGNPYDGRVIDYYYSGKKQGEGTFINGKVEGLRTIYYQNGKLLVENNYKNGLENGLDKEYYKDGSLQQKGEFVNGKEEGMWEDYYPNGQVKLRSFYKNGEVVDTATKFYSNGKVKEKVFIKDGKVMPDPNLKKINELMVKSEESDKEEDYKSAIKYCSKAIELDSTFADAYFSKGTIELNDFQFDIAIKDFDKALQLEPYLYTALANRAFARIRKYQYQNGRILSKNDEVTVIASSDKVAIPADEQEEICNDLKMAVFLGDKSDMIDEALKNYCQEDNQ